METTDDVIPQFLASLATYQKYAAAAPAAPPARVAAAIRQRDARIREAKQKSRDFLERELSLGAQTALEVPFDTTLKYKLAEIFRFFVNRFQLRKRYPGVKFAPAVTLCRTLDEFLQPLLDGFTLSPALRAQALQRLKAVSEQWAREHRGYTGAYLPGQGILVNGWLLGYGRPPQMQGLWTDPGILPGLYRTALHEALGHGFLAEYSALGREKTALRLYSLEASLDFELRTVDTATRTLLGLKEVTVGGASRYLEEGWSTWVSATFTPRAPGEPPTFYTLERLWKTVANYPLPDAARSTLQSLLADLFLSSSGDVLKLFAAVRGLQIISEIPAFSLEPGVELAYVVGSMLIDQLELHLGIENVPFALLIAANVTYDLEQISCGDLETLVNGSIYFNPDCRLAILSQLELPKPEAAPNAPAPSPAAPPAGTDPLAGDQPEPYRPDPVEPDAQRPDAPRPVSLARLTRAARDQLNLAVPAELLD